MANNTKSKPTNFIASGVQEAKKNYLKGARDTNESYAPVAGSELRKGNGAAMAQYNRNRHNIERAESEL
ncbi:hypothetical protein CGH94_04455 [Vibrio parahaemolyticus]|uniref:hypothetical protein n=1 Tax=Vibrio parahaemolyticus TaxID=670 RepID=UPI00111F2109|nr:hypothetical protein [Vibrio parahaemolyticus]ELB2051535.1 hypothetical protein [Vibrio parahaemolyticus]TOL71128.1 hypothetical protein CGH94_04455 [Vibrio parahaemolyticus]HCG9186755.1 hypothetical protein [Vibrio parahaemolyticus]